MSFRLFLYNPVFWLSDRILAISFYGYL